MNKPDCQLAPLDCFVELRPEKITGVKDSRRPYIGLEHIAQGMPQLIGWLPSDASISTNSIFEKDDILFGKLRPNLRKSIRAPFPGYCSTDILVLRAKDNIDPGFAGHVFQWERVFNAASATAVGTKMPRTSWNELRRYLVFLPNDLSEQRRIQAVLDMVDVAISKTQAVIAKLKRIRTGLLHDLLTCGLNHNGELRDSDRHPEQFKDSPLGRIPKEWSIDPLGKVMTDIYDYRGRTPLKLGMEWGDGDIPALSANNVEMGRINFSKETNYGSPALYRRWMTSGDVQESDVLITMEAPLGNIAQIPDEKKYILSQRVVLLRPRQEILNSDYLALQMMGTRFQKELIRNSSGSTAVGIQRSKLEQIMLFSPEKEDEQKHSAQVIREQDDNINAIERELSKLQSLKSGLMSDLLTGHVRVPKDLTLEAGVAA